MFKNNPDLAMIAAKGFYRNVHLHTMQGRSDIAAEIVGAAEFGEPFGVERTH
jgi:hypothetical protein